MMKKAIETGVLILFLVPLFFINIRSSHDWGDDFAQYILQAENIVKGESQNETGYIFNENCFAGPQAYPTGFPLLLSPVVKAKGLDFRSFNYLLTAFLALAAVTGFLTLRLYFSFITSFFAALIVAYNPVFLSFKSEIISDLPFTFFSMLCIYLVHCRPGLALSLLLGLLIGFSIHIRAVGALLIIVFLPWKLLIEAGIRQFRWRAHVGTSVTLLATAFTWLLLAAIFPCKSNYPSIFETENFFETVNDHFSYNLRHLAELFTGYHTEKYYSIGVIASSSLIAFGLLGFVYFAKDHPRSYITWYTPLYIFMVISYKHSHAGMRFLYPVLFCILLFAIYGLRKSIQPLVANTRWVGLAAGTLVLFSYLGAIKGIRQTEDAVQDGPHTPQSVAVFRFINDSVAPGSVIEFDKSRALALFTHARSFCIHPLSTPEEVGRELDKFGASYLLISETQSADVLKAYALSQPETFPQVYANEQFRLYRIKKE
jgi:hypothetical protein